MARNCESVPNVAYFLTLFRMYIFSAAHRWEGAKRPRSLKSATHPTMIKLSTVIPHLKKIQKIYESRDTLPALCWHFFTGNQQIVLTFVESLNIGLLNLIIILMMLAKMAVFWNKGYDVIIPVISVTSKNLSRDSNHNLNFIRIWPEKPHFLREGLGSSSTNWD